MEELLRTNNIVTISFVESLLREAGIEFLIADQNMSIMEGSIGLLPKRILVHRDYLDRARKLCADAGVGAELAKPL